MGAVSMHRPVDNIPPTTICMLDLLPCRLNFILIPYSLHLKAVSCTAGKQKAEQVLELWVLAS
jgi:hypothetical protein